MLCGNCGKVNSKGAVFCGDCGTKLPQNAEETKERGLLEMPDEMIEAAISHEFGHLAHKDTDRMVVVAAGNIFITAVFLILKVIITVFSWLVTVSGWHTLPAGAQGKKSGSGGLWKWGRWMAVKNGKTAGAEYSTFDDAPVCRNYVKR